MLWRTALLVPVSIAWTEVTELRDILVELQLVVVLEARCLDLAADEPLLPLLPTDILLPRLLPSVIDSTAVETEA